jgi:hypothetical protein
MIFRVETVIEVDPDTFWVASDRKQIIEDLEEQLRNLMYDLDYEVKQLNVEEV